ncbi:hypothetical protein Tco_0828367 [Tanacetum coccineum]
MSDWVESTDLMSARSVEEFEERNEDYGGCTRMLKLQYPSSAFDIRKLNKYAIIDKVSLTKCVNDPQIGAMMNPRLQNKSALPLEVREKLATVLAQPTALAKPPLSRDLSYSLQWSGNSTINAEMQQQGYNVKKKMKSQEACKVHDRIYYLYDQHIEALLSLPWKPSAYSATGKPTPLPTTMTLLPPPPPPPSPPPSETTENDVVSDEEDVKFTLMSNSSGDSVESAGDVNVSVSPSDELFFKGGFPYFSVSRCHLLDDSVWVFGCGSFLDILHCVKGLWSVWLGGVPGVVAAYIEWLQSAVKGWGCMFSSANVAANSAGKVQ